MNDIDTVTANRRIEVLNAAVRPLIALAFAGAIIYGFIMGRLSVEAFIGIAGSVMGYWFQQRAQDKADKRISDIEAKIPDPNLSSTTTIQTTTHEEINPGGKDETNKGPAVVSRAAAGE